MRYTPSPDSVLLTQLVHDVMRAQHDGWGRPMIVVPWPARDDVIGHPDRIDPEPMGAHAHQSS